MTQPQTNALGPGVAFYQVLEPGPLLDATGARQYAMTGPFPDIGSASQKAARTPGALLTVTLVLFETPAVAPTPTPANGRPELVK